MHTSLSAPTNTTSRCACCGHDASPAGCTYCHGFARAFDGDVLSVGPRFALADAWRGLRSVLASLFALLHEREFVGLLRLPVAANTITVAALVLFGWLVLAPAYGAVFAGPWPLFDDWRAAHVELGPNLWLAATWLLLGPPLLDLAAGALQDPLRVATETRVLGAPRDARPQPSLLRLRERARVLAAAFLAWPAALVLVLVPWIGVPLVAAAGAANAAIVWFAPPMEARRLTLRQRLVVLWRNRWRAFGTGAGLQLAAAVPFVNLFALAPVAAVAATINYLHFDKRA